jgi:monoamine oxidase
MNTESGVVDVIVLGGGLSGLTAARRLTQAGVTSIRVLEAKDRVGGRTRLRELAGGRVVEDGGQLIGPEYHRLKALGDELGVATWPHHDGGRYILERDGRVLEFDGSMPWRQDPLGSADFTQSLLRLGRLVNAAPTDDELGTAEAARLDSMTFMTWVDRTTKTVTARTMWSIIGALTIGSQPGEMSLLYVLRHVRALGGMESLLASLSGGHERSFAGGSARLAEIMAAELRERVVVGSPIRSVAYDESGVEVTTVAGDVHRARRAVVAMSPADRESIRFEPALPAAQRTLGERMSMAHAYKVHVVYSFPFWRDRGLNGSIMTDAGPLVLTFDDTPPDSTEGVIVGFARADGGPNRYLPDAMPTDPTERRRAALTGLARAFGEQAMNPVEYHEFDWTREPYTVGCIPVWPPGLVTAAGAGYADAVGPPHWAGSELSPKWAGTMEGAILTGERAATEVRNAINHL